MSHPDTPVLVRHRAASPPGWLEVKDPTQVEDIPSLGRKGARGAGEKAAIALAREERADVILMDDKTGRREAKKGISNRFGCSRCLTKRRSGACSATYHRSSNTLSGKPAST